MRYLSRDEQQREAERRREAEIGLEADNEKWRAMAEEGRRRAAEKCKRDAARLRAFAERKAARLRGRQQRASPTPTAKPEQPQPGPRADAVGPQPDQPDPVQQLPERPPEQPIPAPRDSSDFGIPGQVRSKGGRPRGARTHRYHPQGDLRLFLLWPPDADPEVATRTPVPEAPHFANKAAAERWLRAQPALLDGARVEMVRVYSRFAVKARLRPDLDPIRSKNGNERKKLDASMRRFNRTCAEVDGSDPGPYSFCDDFMSKSPCPIDSEAKLEEEPKLVPTADSKFEAAQPIKRRNRNLRRETWGKLTKQLDTLAKRFNVERAVLARARERGESQELQLSIKKRMREQLRDMGELQKRIELYSP